MSGATLPSGPLGVFGAANARRRDAMAAAAAPYVDHRLSSTEHSGAGGGPMKVIIHTGFAYDDDDGAGNVGAQSFAEFNVRHPRAAAGSCTTGLDGRGADVCGSIFCRYGTTRPLSRTERLGRKRTQRACQI